MINFDVLNDVVQNLLLGKLLGYIELYFLFLLIFFTLDEILLKLLNSLMIFL